MAKANRRCGARGWAKLVLPAVLMLVEPPSRAEVWAGLGANGNWTTAANWVDGIIPSSSSTTDIAFSGSSGPTSNVDANSPWIVQSISYLNGAGSFSLGGNQLFFQGPLRRVQQFSSVLQTIDNNVDISGAPNLRISGGGSLAMNGIVSGNGGLNVEASGVLALTASNSYTGTTNVDGLLVISHPSALGSTAGTTGVSNTGVLGLAGGITVVGEQLFLNSSGGGRGGLANQSGNNTWATLITLLGNSSIGSNEPGSTLTVAGAIQADARQLTFSGDGQTVVTGRILNVGSAGSFGLTKSGAGALTLSGSNTIAGSVLVQSGTLIVQGGAALPDNAEFSFQANGGTLRLGASETIGSLFSSGIPCAIDLGAHSLTVNQTTSATFYGAINGSGQVVKQGAGALRLQGGGTFSGGILLTAGTLSAFSDANFGIVGSAPSLVFDANSTLQFGSSFTIAAERTLSLATGVSAAIDSNGQAPVIASRITGPGALVKTGSGTLLLTSTTSDFAGGTTINFGAISYGNPASVAGAGANVLVNTAGTAAAAYPLDQSFLSRISSVSTGAVALGADSGNALNFSAFADALLGSIGTFAYSGVLTPNGTTYRLGGGGGTLLLPGTNALTGARGLEVSLTGTVALLASNDFSGGTVLNGGVTRVAAIGALSSGSVTLNGGTLAFDTVVQTFATPIVFGTNSALQLDNASTVASAIAPASSGTKVLTLQGAATSGTISGVLADGAGVLALRKSGTGVIVLTSSNNYSGGTTLSSGALAVAEDRHLGNVPATPSVNLTLAGGSLRFESAFALDARRTFSVTNTGTTAGIDTNGFDVFLASTITGAGRFVKRGFGTLTLSGSNSGSGSTTIAEGVLLYTSTQALTGSITIRSGAVAAAGYPMDQAFVNRVAANSGGVLALTVSSTNSLNLGSARPVRLGAIGEATYSGTLTPSLGTYRLGGGGGTLYLSNTNALTGANGLDVGTDGTPSGTVRLLAANNYTGLTTITGGTLALGAFGGVAGTPAISVAAGAVFDTIATAGFILATGKTLSGGGKVAGAFTLGQGATLAPGLGSVFGTLSFDNLVVQGAYVAEVNGAGLRDSIFTAGSLDLSAATDSLTVQAADFANGSYVIATYTGTLTGNFNSVTLPPGYVLNYGSGVNSQIIAIPIPEPDITLLFGIGMFACHMRLGRRKRLKGD